MVVAHKNGRHKVAIKFVIDNLLLLCTSKNVIHSFRWGVQNATIPCHSQELLPFLSVMYFFLPPTIIPSSLTSSCHLFLGLPLNLVDPKFIYNTLLGILFSSFSVHAQTIVIYITLLYEHYRNIHSCSSTLLLCNMHTNLTAMKIMRFLASTRWLHTTKKGTL